LTSVAELFDRDETRGLQQYDKFNATVVSLRGQRRVLLVLVLVVVALAMSLALWLVEPDDREDVKGLWWWDDWWTVLKTRGVVLSMVGLLSSASAIVSASANYSAQAPTQRR
jgi:hypothetical protein